MKYVVAIGGPLLFVFLLFAAYVLFPAKAPSPVSSTSSTPVTGTSTPSAPESESVAGDTPTPLTIYSGQPCLDFTAVGSSTCTVSGSTGEITADFAVTSRCPSVETIETIFAFEVSNSITGEAGMASWDPIRDINIAPGQTVNVQHKLSKSVPGMDTYHFRLVILNQKGSLRAEFTTEDAPLCYP